MFKTYVLHYYQNNSDENLLSKGLKLLQVYQNPLIEYNDQREKTKDKQWLTKHKSNIM